MDAKERENFNRNSTLIVEHTKKGFTNLIELNSSLAGHSSFEDFINIKQHEIYHLCYNRSRCCQCTPGYTLPSTRILHPSQLELLFDKTGPKKGCHNPSCTGDFCCSFAHRGLTTDVLDVTLARCLLVNFCQDVFWYSCLIVQGQTLEDFLTKNKHDIYHLYDNNRCCQCPVGYVYPTQRPVLNRAHWNQLFSTPCLPCPNDRNPPISGPQTICATSVTLGIQVGHLGPDISQLLIEHCCTLKKGIETLVQLRNKVFGHIKEARIPDNEYTRYRNEIESYLCLIGRICKNEGEVKQNLKDLDTRTLDGTLLIQTIKDQLYATEMLREGMAQMECGIKEHFDEKFEEKLGEIKDEVKKIIIKEVLDSKQYFNIKMEEKAAEIKDEVRKEAVANKEAIQIIGHKNDESENSHLTCLPGVQAPSSSSSMMHAPVASQTQEFNLTRNNIVNNSNQTPNDLFQSLFSNSTINGGNFTINVSFNNSHVSECH